MAVYYELLRVAVINQLSAVPIDWEATQLLVAVLKALTQLSVGKGR